MKNTITQQQASERAGRYVRDAVSALSPAAQLEVSGRFDDSPCDDPTDNGPKGRVIASVTYWLNDIPVDRQSDYVNALFQWWSEHDFTVLTDNPRTTSTCTSRIETTDPHGRPANSGRTKTIVAGRHVSVRVAERHP